MSMLEMLWKNTVLNTAFSGQAWMKANCVTIGVMKMMMTTSILERTMAKRNSSTAVKETDGIFKPTHITEMADSAMQ